MQSILPRYQEKSVTIVSSEAKIFAAEFPEALNSLPKNSRGDLVSTATV
jgi:hypothetical protein